MENVFMFTVATNGYDEVFADYLETQKNYAAENKYTYHAITKTPPYGISGSMSAWLKIPITLRALRAGYDWVFFVDADCKINAHTPPVQSVFTEGKSIYFCHDWTRRINSGVMIVYNTKDSVNFFRKVFYLADVPGFLLPKNDRNLYENGHVITVGKSHPAVEILDDKWNYISDQPNDNVYIKHGGERYYQKPRIKASHSRQGLVLHRLRETPRIFHLQRLVRFYETIYPFQLSSS